jgi:hypothetical protein
VVWIIGVQDPGGCPRLVCSKVVPLGSLYGPRVFVLSGLCRFVSAQMRVHFDQAPSGRRQPLSLLLISRSRNDGPNNRITGPNCPIRRQAEPCAANAWAIRSRGRWQRRAWDLGNAPKRHGEAPSAAECRASAPG